MIFTIITDWIAIYSDKSALMIARSWICNQHEAYVEEAKFPKRQYGCLNSCLRFASILSFHYLGIFQVNFFIAKTVWDTQIPFPRLRVCIHSTAQTFVHYNLTVSIHVLNPPQYRIIAEGVGLEVNSGIWLEEQVVQTDTYIVSPAL